MERLHPPDGGVWGNIFRVATTPDRRAQRRHILDPAAWLGVVSRRTSPWGHVCVITRAHGGWWLGSGPIHLVWLHFIVVWRHTLGTVLAVWSHTEMHTVFWTEGFDGDIRPRKAGVRSFLGSMLRLWDRKWQRQNILHRG